MHYPILDSQRGCAQREIGQDEKIVCISEEVQKRAVVISEIDEPAVQCVPLFDGRQSGANPADDFLSRIGPK